MILRRLLAWLHRRERFTAPARYRNGPPMFMSQRERRP